jgi:hypothetical protein
MSNGNMMDDDEIDALFAEAKAQEGNVSDAFLARVLADAADVAAERAVPVTYARPEPKRGFFAGMSEAIGGWRGGMALTASAVAGLYFGFADPVGVDTVSGLASSLSGATVSDTEADQTVYDLFLEG